MKIGKKVNEYLKSGKPVFVYSLVGTETEIEAYKAASQASTDETKVLFFSTRPVNSGDEVVLSQKGNYSVQSGNLEAQAIAHQTLVDNAVAKFEGLQKFAGMTKEEIIRLVMA